MSTPIDAPRRRFIGQVVAGAASVAGIAYARAAATAQSVTPSPPPGRDSTAATPPPPPGLEAAHRDWDLSWVDRIQGQHRQVFDCPEIAEGAALSQARLFLHDYKDVYKLTDADIRAVLVVRHKAFPIVLNDAIWERYDFIGKKRTKLKDPTTGKWARRNPFLNAKKDDEYSLVWDDGGLDALISQGVIVLACNLAMVHFAGIIAKETQQEPGTVQDEVRKALVPGVTLVPSGVFGVIRSEQAGCNYLR